MTRCYLPTSTGDIPTFTPPTKAGPEFSSPEGVQGRVDPSDHETMWLMLYRRLLLLLTAMML